MLQISKLHHYIWKSACVWNQCSWEGLKWEISENVCDNFQTSGLYSFVQQRNGSVFTCNQFLFHLISKINPPSFPFHLALPKKSTDLYTCTHKHTALNWLCHLQMRIRLKTGSDNGRKPLRQKWYMGMKTSYIHTIAYISNWIYIY